MPVLFAWIWAIPIAVVTSSPVLGEFLLNAGLFPDAFGDDERNDLGELATGFDRSDARVPGGRETVIPKEERFVAGNARGASPNDDKDVGKSTFGRPSYTRP